MIQKIYVLMFFMFLSIPAISSHIVGGEVTLKFSPAPGLPDRYQVKLRFFRENGPFTAPLPSSMQGAIVQKLPNLVKQTLNFNLSTSLPIQYDDEDCVPNDQALQAVDIGTYVGFVNMPASQYSSANGYYIYFETCCRNSGVVNYDTNTGSDVEWYMEFPSLTQYPGYSSPVFNVDPVTFLLVRKQFNANYKVTKPGGGKFKYDMVNPLRPGTNGQANNPMEFTSPAYNLETNIMNSQPSATLIDPITGIIGFVPNLTGKFLLAFRCSDIDSITGVKIGEIRREFQLEVFPNTESPPLAQDDQNSSSKVEYTFFSDQDTVINFTIRDDPKDKITVFAEPINGSISPIALGASFGAGGGSNDTIVQLGPIITGIFAWSPTCAMIADTPYKFNIISHDNTCPVFFYDTIQVTVFIKARENFAPYFVASKTVGSTDTLISEIRVKGDQKLTLPTFFALDSNQKDIPFVALQGELKNNPAIFSRVSLNLNQAQRETAINFEWQTVCSDVREDPYLVIFKVKDNACPAEFIDSALYFFLVYVDSPFNKGPVISALQAPLDTVRVKVGETLNLVINATDTLNGDVYNILNLEADISAFNGTINPATFNNVVGALDSASAIFSWKPDCSEASLTPYKLEITTFDNGCPVDTNKKTYLVFVDREANIKPAFVNANSIIIASVNAGATYSLNLTSNDPDSKYKLVTIQADLSAIPTGIINPPTFASTPANSSATAIFNWNTDCTSADTVPYVIIFKTFDDLCPFPDTTFLRLELTIIPAPNNAPTFTNFPATVVNADLVYAENYSIDFLAADLQTAQNVTISATSVLFTDPLIINKPVFTPISGNGTASASFTWTPDCKLVNNLTYSVTFVVKDNACPNPDSTIYIYNFKVIENLNYTPVLSIEDTVRVTAGDLLNEIITAQNNVSSSGVIITATSELFNLSPNPAVYTPDPNAQGKAEGALRWQTDCANLRTEPYLVTFKSYYGDCVSDTITKIMYVKVVPLDNVEKDFPNVFTPNGDGKNDQYSIVENYKVFCDTEFNFLIFDRWGKKVFESSDPAFRWDGDEKADGTYFYVLKSKVKEKSGSITLLR